jgi:hypothetical protein
MDETVQSLIALARLTLTDPSEGARRVKALDVPRAVLWQGFALVVVMSVLLTEVGALASPASVGMVEFLHLSPFFAGAVQALVLWMMVHATHRVGAAFGGEGSFEESVKLVVWLQAMLVGLQAVQLVAFFLVPALAVFLGIASLAWFFWVLTSFVMVLHGFESRAKVFLGILLAFVALVFGLSVLLAMLGVVVAPPEGIQ